MFKESLRAFSLPFSNFYEGTQIFPLYSRNRWWYSLNLAKFDSAGNPALRVADSKSMPTSSPKRPRDVNQRAAQIVALSTGQAQEAPPAEKKRQPAKNARRK